MCPKKGQHNAGLSHFTSSTGSTTPAGLWCLHREYYAKCVRVQKLKPCASCSGSGYYDHNGSPSCGACSGAGKERVPTFEEYLWESAAHQAKVLAENAAQVKRRRSQRVKITAGAPTGAEAGGASSPHRSQPSVAARAKSSTRGRSP